MLTLLKNRIPTLFFGSARISFRAGELGHQQPAPAEAANHAPKQRVGDASHRRKHRRRPDGQISNLELFRNHHFNFSAVYAPCLAFSAPLFASFRKCSRRRNFRCNAPLYADHSSSPESLASAARTAAILESKSSK